MRWRMVIFDCDGTLADSYPWFRAELPGLAARHGFRVPAEPEIEALRRLAPTALLRTLGVAPWRVPAITSDLRARKLAAAGGIPLFPGVAAMLAGLTAQGVTLGLVSSDSEPSIRRTLGAAIDHLPHRACGASLFGKAARLQRVLRAAGVAPASAIYVGDELRDGEAAARAGCAFGAVGWGYMPADALDQARPARRFAAVEELLALAG